MLYFFRIQTCLNLERNYNIIHEILLTLSGLNCFLIKINTLYIYLLITIQITSKAFIQQKQVLQHPLVARLIELMIHLDHTNVQFEQIPISKTSFVTQIAIEYIIFP